jgi:hypothetical protein
MPAVVLGVNAHSARGRSVSVHSTIRITFRHKALPMTERATAERGKEARFVTCDMEFPFPLTPLIGE